MIREFCTLAASLGIFVTGCCNRPAPESSVASVPVLVSRTDHPIVPRLAYKQLSAERISVVGQTGQRVFSIAGGMADVCTVSQHPIIAEAEQDCWFFYATSVATDEATHRPAQFISGFAIARGGRQIIYWSVG